MSDGVQRGKATVSRSVRDCLPICLPSTTHHSTFQRTPADDVPAYLAPRPPGGRQWHGRSQTPNLDPNLGPPPATGITNRLLDRCGLGNQLASVMRVRTAPRPGLWLLSLAPMCSDVCCQIAAKNDLLP